MKAVTFNHRGTLIATLGLDETVRLWVPATERQIAFRADGKSFERLQFGQNDRRLMAIDDKRTNPSVWEVAGDEYMVLQARAGPVDQLKNIDFSPDGRWLAAVSGEQATTTTRSSPVPVSGGHRFSALSAGGEHTCGVTTTGTALCWGSGYGGELGGAGGGQTTPAPVSGGLRFASLSAGWGHTCGVTVTGALYCWGSNASGQVGDGSTADRSEPVPVVQ